jgi:plastocyanin
LQQHLTGISRLKHVALLTIAAFAVSACSGFNGPVSPTGGAAAMAGADAVANVASAGTAVTIADSKYQPKTLRTKVGTTVKWSNEDPLAHTVSADDNSFTSAFLTKGHSYKHAFTKAGKYPYHCKIHPYMTGMVIVTK